MNLNARATKITLVLNSAEVKNLRPPDTPRIVLKILANGGRVVTADIATKSLRKAIANIKEAGVDGVIVILQGKLEADNSISECGLAAQVKIPPQVKVPASVS